MNNKNDNFADVIFGSVIFCAIGGLTVASIAFAWQDDYKWGIKESPAVVNIQGDQTLPIPMQAPYRHSLAMENCSLMGGCA